MPLKGGYLLATRKGSGRWDTRRLRSLRDISLPSRRGGLTTRQISRLTEQPISTVRAHLNQMKTKNLVFRRHGLWYRLAWDPDLVAQEEGIDDVPAKRKERYLNERRRWWEGRAALPPEHRMHVLREEHSVDVDYVHPRTGEVLWRDTRPAVIKPEERS